MPKNRASRTKKITAVGRTAPVSPLPPIGYRFAAVNRRFLVGEASRVYWLKITITLVFVAGLLMSVPLWIGPRSYPLASVFRTLPATVQIYDTLLFAGLLGAAAMILISSKPQKFIGIFLGIVAVYCVLDQTRWQPWVYQYSFLLAALALFSWDGDDTNGQRRVRGALFRQYHRGADLYDGCREGGAAAERSELSGAHVA
jgi:hypothetical protein